MARWRVLRTRGRELPVQMTGMMWLANFRRESLKILTQKQAGYSRCTEGREWVGLGRPGREAYMQVYMYKNKFWDKFSKKPNNKFIHVDLHVGFPAWVAQADFRLSPVHLESVHW